MPIAKPTAATSALAGIAASSAAAGIAATLTPSLTITTCLLVSNILLVAYYEYSVAGV